MSETRTKADSVYRRLKGKLASGKLKPGARLTEAKVARMFGTGRGPARESMLRLVSEGALAKDGAYGGVYVRYIEESNREVVAKRYELREMIEGLAARLAADHMTGRDIRELRRLDREILHAVGDRDPEGRIDACLAFHRLLLTRCGNELLFEVAEKSNLVPMLARSPELDEKVLRSLMPRGGKSTWLTPAVKAIAAHDPDAAEQAMRGWIRSLTEAVRERAEQP